MRYTYRKEQEPGLDIVLQTQYRYTSQWFEDGLGASAEDGLDRGLYFYGARWYDSSLGRFIQPDTIVPEPGNPQSLNRYSYVNNRPTVFIDPTGYRLEEGAGFAVCGGIGCIYPVGHPLAGYLIGTTQEDVAQAKAEMKAAGEVVVGILWEPADWALTANHWRQGDFHVLDLAGLLPFVPATGMRALRHADEVADIIKRNDEIIEGIYEFTDLKSITRKTYGGQSQNIPARLKRHVNAGRLESVDDAIVTEITGGEIG